MEKIPTALIRDPDGRKAKLKVRDIKPTQERKRA
jgi:hypothetical protein